MLALDLKAFIEDAIGATITVIDNKEFNEKYNPTTRKIEIQEIPSFEDDVLVYVPDGIIGDVQCGKPFYMETPGARVVPSAARLYHLLSLIFFVGIPKSISNEIPSGLFFLSMTSFPLLETIRLR